MHVYVGREGGRESRSESCWRCHFHINQDPPRQEANSSDLSGGPWTPFRTWPNIYISYRVTHPHTMPHTHCSTHTHNTQWGSASRQTQGQAGGQLDPKRLPVASFPKHQDEMASSSSSSSPTELRPACLLIDGHHMHQAWEAAGRL